MTKTIKSLSEIRKATSRVYVRWSQSIDLDNERGYSLRFGSQSEAGLSACEIDTSWEDWRIIRQLAEYRFCGGSCWIVTGQEVGRGGDNEPLLRKVKAIGKVSKRIFNSDWRKMKLAADIKDHEDKLTRLTDVFAIRIYEKDLAKLQKEWSEKYG